jgi:hypothetical protein
MASMYCNKCGALLIDTGLGYATTCEHSRKGQVPVIDCQCSQLYALHTEQGQRIKDGGQCDECMRKKRAQNPSVVNG